VIGGKVIEVRPEGDRARIWCMDTQRDDECAIYVCSEDEMPVPGDTVWWQGGKAYWTPSDRRFTDRSMTKVGNSFDPRNIFA
jgi:hypothetical protein